MTDILAVLDAAIAEADATTDALCEQFFAEAMVGVRDAIDGSVSEDPFCDSLDCTQVEDSGGYPCANTLARWRPAEADELVHLHAPRRAETFVVPSIDGIRVSLHTADSPGWRVVGTPTGDLSFSWATSTNDSWGASLWGGIARTRTMTFSFDADWETIRHADGFTFEEPSRTIPFQGRHGRPPPFSPGLGSARP